MCDGQGDTEVAADVLVETCRDSSTVTLHCARKKHNILVVISVVSRPAAIKGKRINLLEPFEVITRFRRMKSAWHADCGSSDVEVIGYRNPGLEFALIIS